MPQRPTRRRHVQSLPDEAGGELRRTEIAASLAERRLDRSPNGVRDGADPGPVVRGERSDAPQHTRQLALLAEHLDLESIERRRVGGACNRLQRAGTKRVEIAGQVGEVHGSVGAPAVLKDDP